MPTLRILHSQVRAAMTNSLIQPRTLKGFRDYLPEAMIPRERLVETARQVYRSFGFLPIETPALEYSEILCGKGSEETDRQMFRFQDHGGRDVALRFDLTVPLARFVAEHSDELIFPFKRYHIGTVWRGEKPQVGRFREFAQCDFDTIGTTSIAADVETAIVIHDLMRAIGFQEFQIRVNNRKILNGVLEKTGLGECSVAVLRAIDKLPKVGSTAVRAEIAANTEASESQLDQILGLASLQGANQYILEQLKPICAGNRLAEQGMTDLEQLWRTIDYLGIGPEHFAIDVAIARGLDYYTGTVFETFLTAAPHIGSVCSGGRYDNLAELFTRQQLPGIGASLGLDRLLAAMQMLQMIEPTRSTAEVLILQFDSQLLSEYLRLAGQLRAAGIPTEVYPDAKKIGQQFKYADRKGFRAVIVAGSDEFAKRKIQMKRMNDGTQHEIRYDGDIDEIVEWLKR
jgi:histidyl-tRNA synthetase